MPSPNVGQLLAHPHVRAAIERALAARGVKGDTIIAHLDPREAAMLRMMGGAGTVNPRTGLRQFFTGGNADPDAGGVGGSVGRGTDSGSTSGTNQGGYGHASDSGGGYGPLGVVGDIPGAIGRAISGIGGFLDRASGNFGQGWGSRGVAGGYGGADNDTGAGYAGGIGGRGVGGGGLSGGHSGQNYISQQFGVNPTGIAPASVAPLPTAPVISNMPQAPVSLTPMMSSTATIDLAGGERFGALPSWATQPYQVGTEPSSYPTPGVNAGLGAPGFAGNPLPGQPGGAPMGGGGLPGGGGGGLPAGGGGSGLLGGGGLPAGGQAHNQFGPDSTLTVPQQMMLAKQLRLSPGALDRLTTPPLGISQVAYQRLTPQQKASWDAARGHPTFTAPPLGISQAAYQKLTPQQKASWAAATGQPALAASPTAAKLLGPAMGQTAARPTSQPTRPAARPATQPARPAALAAPQRSGGGQPATMTAQAKAQAAAKAKAAAAAKARTAARTGGKNFG